MSKKGYVCGFLFSPDLEYVILIEKTHPDWQKGKLNGVGGKIEDKETPLQAMTREFYEEAGVNLLIWNGFATLDGMWNDGSTSDWRVNFFYRQALDWNEFQSCKTMTDEAIFAYQLDSDQWRKHGVPNLSWVIPMALDRAKNPDNNSVFIMTEVITK